MFDALSDRLRQTLATLTGRGRITEADVDVAMREIRLALLEADVNFKVVKDFIARVREQAVGAEIIGSLTAGQQVVKIVHDELVALLGTGDRSLPISGQPGGRRPRGTPGFGQDDDGGEARPAHRQARPTAVAGGRRSLSTRRRGPARDARQGPRHSRPSRAGRDDRRRHRASRRRGGRKARPRHGDHRHGRSAQRSTTP